MEKASTMHDWVVWCKSKWRAEEIRSFELSRKEILFNHDETKSKEENNKKNGSNKKAHRGQSVRHRSWWKQGNIIMAVSEDHASCWVQKDQHHTYTYTYTHTHTHTPHPRQHSKYRRTNTHTHTFIHTHIFTHKHTHTHTPHPRQWGNTWGGVLIG